MRGSLAAFLLVLSACVCLITWKTLHLLNSLDLAAQAASQTIAALPSQLDHQGALTRRLLADSRDQILQAANRHLDDIQVLLEQRSTKLQETIDIVSYNATSLGVLGMAELDRTNNILASLRKDLKPPLRHLDNLIIEADDLTARINLAAKPLLDCKSNGACLPAQTLALVGSARYTMGQIARAAPETTVAVKQSSQSIAKIAEHVSKKQPWYGRIFGLIRIISAAKILLL